MTPAIETCELTRQLTDPEPIVLVQGVSLRIDPGEWVAVVGPSGCGKSSLLYLLGLLDRPSSGSLFLTGRDAHALTEQERTAFRLQRVGFIFQFHFLLPELSAAANVALPMRRLGHLELPAIRTRTQALLDRFGLGEIGGRRPDRLSGGQRQRIAIVRALANDPALLLADEPTGNLDSVNTALVIETFRDLAHREGRTILCVTHDANVAKAADRRIHMLDGRIVMES